MTGGEPGVMLEPKTAAVGIVETMLLRFIRSRIFLLHKFALATVALGEPLVAGAGAGTGGAVLSGGLATVGRNYAAQNKRMGNMTWGEYVHFTSGAANKDLKPLATTAFGWPADWDAQLAAARQKYPQLTY